MTTLPTEHQSRLDRELDEAEEIRWVAQPIARVLRRDLTEKVRTLVILFSAFALILLMFAVADQIWNFNETESPALLYVLAGINFGFALLSRIAVLVTANGIARNTIYALTNKRAIIITVHRDGSITERDYRGDELIHLARKEFKDGSGTLTFESARGAGHTSQTASRHRFQAIERVIEVERMLRDQFGAC